MCHNKTLFYLTSGIKRPVWVLVGGVKSKKMWYVALLSFFLNPIHYIPVPASLSLFLVSLAWQHDSKPLLSSTVSA